MMECYLVHVVIFVIKTLSQRWWSWYNSTPASIACSLSPPTPHLYQLVRRKWKPQPSGASPSSRHLPHRWLCSRQPPPSPPWARHVCTEDRVPLLVPKSLLLCPLDLPPLSRTPLRGEWSREGGGEQGEQGQEQVSAILPQTCHHLPLEDLEVFKFLWPPISFLSAILPQTCPNLFLQVLIVYIILATNFLPLLTSLLDRNALTCHFQKEVQA